MIFFIQNVLLLSQTLTPQLVTHRLAQTTRLGCIVAPCYQLLVIFPALAGLLLRFYILPSNIVLSILLAVVVRPVWGLGFMYGTSCGCGHRRRKAGQGIYGFS